MYMASAMVRWSWALDAEVRGGLPGRLRAEGAERAGDEQFQVVIEILASSNHIVQALR